MGCTSANVPLSHLGMVGCVGVEVAQKRQGAKEAWCARAPEVLTPCLYAA